MKRFLERLCDERRVGCGVEKPDALCSSPLESDSPKRRLSKAGTDSLPLQSADVSRLRPCSPRFANPSAAILAGLLCFSMPPFGAFGDAGFAEITGRVEYRFFLEDNAIESGTNRFKVVTDGSASRLTTVGLPTLSGGKVAAYEFSSDGTNSVFVTLFVEPTGGRVANGQPIVSNTQTGQVAVESHNAFADVYTGPFPPVHTGLLGPVWLAYASGGFLSRSSSDQLPPFSFMGPGWPHIAGPTLRSKWNTKSDALTLPQQMEQWSDPNVFEFMQSVQQTFGMEQFPDLYRTGFACISYNVKSWTNTGKVEIPMQWTLVRRIPSLLGGSITNLVVQLTYEGFTETVQVKESGVVELIQSLPTWTKVSDYHFGSETGQPVIYTSERGAVLSASELRAKQSRGSNSARGWSVKFVIFTLFILPVVWFALARLSGSKSQITKT